jgi:protein SCO1/2
MESSDLAIAKRNTYVDPLSAEGINADSWRFYTASKSVIKTLTGQTGFEYYYDADLLQYIHPSVLIFATPEHVVARYLYGSYFQPDNFDHALVESGEGTVGSLR